jgi:hypothetical protein
MLLGLALAVNATRCVRQRLPTFFRNFVAACRAVNIPRFGGHLTRYYGKLRRYGVLLDFLHAIDIVHSTLPKNSNLRSCGEAISSPLERQRERIDSLKSACDHQTSPLEVPMSFKKASVAAIMAMTLSACSSMPSSVSSITTDFTSVFGGSEVAPQVAASHPDGSLAPGVGRTGNEDRRSLTSAEKTAEEKSIEQDIPYGVSRP